MMIIIVIFAKPKKFIVPPAMKREINKPIPSIMQCIIQVGRRTTIEGRVVRVRAASPVLRLYVFYRSSIFLFVFFFLCILCVGYYSSYYSTYYSSASRLGVLLVKKKQFHPKDRAAAGTDTYVPQWETEQKDLAKYTIK